MTRGATWSPSYDLRVGTETDSVSCTYYGRVSQNTAEEWQGGNEEEGWEEEREEDWPARQETSIPCLPA